jgi:hypothetical protein
MKRSILLAVLAAFITTIGYAAAPNESVSPIDLTAITAITDDDLLLTVNDPAGAPTLRKITAANVKQWIKDYADTLYPAIALVNQDVTSTANPAFSTINVVGANALNLGTSRVYDGSIRFKSGVALNDFTFTFRVPNLTEDTGWMFPASAPTANGSYLTATTNGTLSYTDPASIGYALFEVDGHAAANLTAAQVRGTTIYNTGQADEDVLLTLPAAAAGYHFRLVVGTVGTKKWGVWAAATDKIYVVALNGTISTPADQTEASFAATQIGQTADCWTVKTDAYDWVCKALAVGSSTFIGINLN